MSEIRFRLTLSTDAEPGTGLGTELLNDLVPRSASGAPYIPASHLKGILRDELRSIASQLGWNDELERVIFGEEGRDGTDGVEGACRFSDLHPAAGVSYAGSISPIARTAIGKHGTAADGSLRTVECVGAGSAFDGAIRLRSSAPPVALETIRLMLLSLAAIGGNRNRGAGRCWVEINGEAALRPSELLRKIAPIAATLTHAPVVRRVAAVQPSTSARTAVLQLTFHASDPVCCLAVPLTGTNVMRSGFAIPASAVQGALLHLLDRENHEAASTLFLSASFRAWPLLPCALRGEEPRNRIPTWTSLTHRMSKLAAGVESAPTLFKDQLIEPYNWRDVPSGAPLKAADGVLLRDGDSVTLWRAADMSRQHSAHVNLQEGEPRLFSVEAMSPMVYRGWLTVPEEFADRIMKVIQAADSVAFGRARAVRGGGKLTAVRANESDLALADASANRASATVFIVQSPIAIPKALIQEAGGSLHGGGVLARLVESSGFGACKRAEANIEVRFGWNRHGAGARVATTNRLAAEAVISPGSVFELERASTDTTPALLRGIGEGRERGFGAVAPHPGISSGLFQGAQALREIRSRDNAGNIADRLSKLGSESGLSTSAVAQLVALARGGPKALVEFLERQRARPTAQWKRWEPLANSLTDIIGDKNITNETRARAFRAWTDATSAKGGRE